MHLKSPYLRAHTACRNAEWLHNLQDHFEQAVSCSYETVLLGHRSAQPQLIAASTVNVAKAGQRYVEMLAEVVARLVKDGHGRPAAKVNLRNFSGATCVCLPCSLQYEWMDGWTD